MVLARIGCLGVADVLEQQYSVGMLACRYTLEVLILMPAPAINQPAPPEVTIAFEHRVSNNIIPGKRRERTLFLDLRWISS